MIAIDLAGDGEPLVLLHGVGANRGVWRHVLPSLAAVRRVVAVDLPGFGDSSAAGQGFALDDAAEELANAIAERVTTPFDLVGTSLGGAVALVLARRRPELVRRLVLVAPAGFSPAPRLVSVAAGHLIGPWLSFRRVLGTAAASNGIARRALFWGAIAAPQRLSADDVRTMLDASLGATRIGPAVTTVMEADLRAELAGLEAPCGLIWGDCDRIVPIATVRSIRSVRPEVILETIPGAAHVPQIERPAEFVLALERLLDRL